MARQPSLALFKKADMEGYLEKVGFGLTSKLKAGRTKLWCELSGTSLHISKESKTPGVLKHFSRTSTGIQQMNMRQVQTVRRAASDKTGLQFEILCNNKPQTFCAASADDCNTWIRHLQRAMTLQEEDTAQVSTDISAVTLGDYETIKVLPEDVGAVSPVVMRRSSVSNSGYEEVTFPSNPPPPKPRASDGGQSCANPSDGQTGGLQKDEDPDYAPVEVRVSSSGQRELQQVEKRTKSVVAASSSPSSSSTGDPTPYADKDTDAYGYSTVRSKSSAEVKEAQPGPPLIERTDAEGCEETEDDYGYAKVDRQRTLSTSESVRSSDTRPAGDGECSDGSDDDDEDSEDFVNFVTEEVKEPVPCLAHRLMQDDLEPLEALRGFLSDNRRVCRRSFHDKTSAEDPIADMKRLLQELLSC